MPIRPENKTPHDDCGLCVVLWVAVLAIPGLFVWAKLFKWAVWLAFRRLEW